MHDIRAIRENPNAFDAGLLSRGVDPVARTLLELDERRRTGITDAQTATERANALSREIGAAMRAGETDRADALKREAWDLKEAARHYQDDADEAEKELDQRLARLPNLPLADVPYGKDAEANVLYREHHEVHRAHLESGRQHFEIGEALGLMDFEAASAMSGARFVVLKGHLARLERALGQFMLDLHTARHGYTEVNPPLLVRENALFGTGQLPKFADDQFRAGDEHWLIPTAEVPLTNLVRDKILSEGALPLRYTALTPCFRLEAGSAGRDTRGMLRQHQFNKVELVAITTPDASLAEHERMLDCAEQVMKRLDLRFRTMTLCTGDMGFGAAKTYDIEVWMPGQSQYREISSVSTFRDFQARRMAARYRAGAGKPAYVHTLNGSGTAVGRALIAVMENYQNPDGSITIPDALVPHMGLSADFQPIRRIGGKDAL